MHLMWLWAPTCLVNWCLPFSWGAYSIPWELVLAKPPDKQNILCCTISFQSLHTNVRVWRDCYYCTWFAGIHWHVWLCRGVEPTAQWIHLTVWTWADNLYVLELVIIRSGLWDFKVGPLWPPIAICMFLCLHFPSLCHFVGPACNCCTLLY